MYFESLLEKLLREQREREAKKTLATFLATRRLTSSFPNPFLKPPLLKKRVFVSFDYDNDKHYKFLLEAWNKNPKFRFVFKDTTPQEINSFNIGVIKAGLTNRIKEATHTLIIVGRYANVLHPKHKLIGHRNWINFEIYQSKLYGKKIAAIKLNKLYDSPDELLGANATWAMNFTENAIIRALENAT